MKTEKFNPNLADEKKTCLQKCFSDYVDWCSDAIPGKNFAERHKSLCLNWLDTVGKSPAEIWWDDIRGRDLLHKNIKEVLKEIEGEKDG